MPLTDKGRKVMAAMKKEYGDKKGEEVFYASSNAGKITGVHEQRRRLALEAARLRHQLFPHLRQPGR